jgi:hypothetical protein
MRQWALVFALLLGLAGDGYLASSRLRLPIPIERRLDSFTDDSVGGEGRTSRTARTGRTLDWWRA